MSGYMEKNSKPSLNKNEQESNDNDASSSSSSTNNEEDYIYRLIGVTVHTGTAEGGHYLNDLI
jgi:ubiquitin C-terminal hydrolase